MKSLEEGLQAGKDWDERNTDIVKQYDRTIETRSDVEATFPIDSTVLRRTAATRIACRYIERAELYVMATERLVA